jgi:hypothetical protein
LSPLLFQSRAFGGELLGDGLDHMGRDAARIQEMVRSLFAQFKRILARSKVIEKTEGRGRPSQMSSGISQGFDMGHPPMEEIIRSRSFRGGWRCAAWFGRSSPAS